MATRPKHAEPRPVPRLYLLTPALADTAAFAVPLGEALGAGDIAAVLLRLADADERTLINHCKALAPLVQSRGVALLLDRPDLVARAGADGAHLKGLDGLADTMERLKPDRIVGAGGLSTRHDAMIAAEQGADYVMFGEPADTGERPTFAAVEERVAWWAEVFEAPCVAYAASPAETAPLVEAGADFVALGEWLWTAPAGAGATVRAAAVHLRLSDMPEAAG